MERIDGLIDEYEAVLAAIRPRQDADVLNRDYGRTIESLRYDPDTAPAPSQWRREDVQRAAEQIMKGIKWKKVKAPVS